MMKLLSARIQNYKCVDDSDVFTVDQMTCLVGKNESGKTALLQALYKLNPVLEVDANFDELEYPRSRDDDGPSDTNVVTTRWELGELDRDALRELFGEAADSIAQVGVTKGYDNKREWEIEIDSAKIAAWYIASADLYEEEREAINNSATPADLLAALSSFEEPGPNIQKLQERINQNIPAGDVLGTAVAVLEKRLPRFVYFSEYYMLPGRVSINEITAKTQGQGKLTLPDRVFMALLELANVGIADIKDATTLESLIAKLERVSNRITRQIFEYWSQNRHLKVLVRCDRARSGDPAPFNDGYVVQTRIENLRHGSTVNFDERSRGFVWFFSFLIWFSQVRKTYGNNLIILLDEPGLNLHARAQADLLRYMREKLCPLSQVVYSTHSPFMVDPDDLLCVRTVEDVTVGDVIVGTKVGDKSLSADADTLFPLQAALGYDITQTLFVGKHTLLVEGPSDLLYLKWMSRELQLENRMGLDPRWMISPCGGIAKVSSFLALFGSHLHVAVLADFHDSEKRKVRDIRESKLLRAGHVLTAEVYADQAEADLEDLFGRDTYVALVNQCYGLKGKDGLPAKPRSNVQARVVKEVEDHFCLLPPEIPGFDHFAPAAYAVENAHSLRTSLPRYEIALERFERLFVDINALLAAEPMPVAGTLAGVR